MIRKLMAIGGALVVPVILLSMLWFSRSAAAVELTDITVCKTGSCNYTTISDAVLNANDGDVIQVEPGTYVENVFVDRSVTIEGQGAGVIIDGGKAGAVLTVDTDFIVSIANLTLRNGSSIDGGGISNDGTITVTNCIIQNNEATDAQGGGGISNFGNMTLQQVVVISNSASFGAGIYNVDLLTADNISVTDNSTLDSGGGGITNDGAFYLTNSLVLSNTAGANGGGIDNSGEITVSLSTVKGNSAGVDGGGVYNDGAFKLIRSLVYDNDSINVGGGIHNWTGGSFSAINSTISGNAANNQGGGIHNEGVGATAVFSSSAIYNNSTGLGSQVGGVSSVTGTVTLNNTIIAHLASAADGSDCSASNIISAGSNLDSDGTCSLGVGELISVTNPLLGPLQDNGGPTWTHALQMLSPAIDAATVCEAIDQRGVARPVGGACDIGPYETAVYRIYTPVVINN